MRPLHGVSSVVSRTLYDTTISHGGYLGLYNEVSSYGNLERQPSHHLLTIVEVKDEDAIETSFLLLVAQHSLGTIA